MDPGSETVTALRAARVTDHGSSVANWAGGFTEWPITGCSVQPGASAEDLGHREAQQVAFTVFMPYRGRALELTGDDRLLVRGHQCPIIGDPEQWPDPDPNVAHVKALVASWRDLA